MIEVNKAGIQTIWEGRNKKGEFRRVLYIPYTDGYVVFGVTDKDGMLLKEILPDDISCQYLPKELEYKEDLQDKPRYAPVIITRDFR
jgi:hypothetical protein